jgi:YegS/Rv2252/BmrU family lipid kinase
MSDVFDPGTARFRIIFNPISGHTARNARLRELASSFLREHRLHGDIVNTTHPHHATELAQAAIAEGCDVVVAMGGDGTLNEVARAITDSPAILGLIPCGSGNGLGRHLNLGAGRHALPVLHQGRVRTIDTGEANGLPFFNVMGVGFDAEISSQFNHLTKRGFLSYVRTGLRAWQTYQPDTYTIQHDDRQRELSAFVIAVANSDQYGNDCFIAPGAEVDDGKLDLTAIKPFGNLSVLPLAARLFRRNAHRSPHVEQFRGERFTIHRSKAGPIHTDGEVHETDAVVTVAIKPDSLKVLVPA